ncbi:MAG TPA: ferrochelatase [Gemmatimonadales bacterium]|nr:ferrochelatase [Gemmatimonadales bacterium]
MAAERTAVLLMAYGGPDSLADVEPYLLDVRGGRATPKEIVEEVRARYARIGGKSPLRRLTEAQAARLASELGPAYRVYVGMRHWHPYIRDTVERIVADGSKRVVAIVMAPHYSALSVGVYEKKLLEAAAGRVETALVRSWGMQPLLLETLSERMVQALQHFPSPRGVRVIFTAHSLPQRIAAAGDPYPEELAQTAESLAKRRGLTGWELAYQSAGKSPEPWLGPDVGDRVRDLALQGVKGVLVVPIGFVCDHVEILFDLDVELQAIARGVGVQLERTASLNDDPALARLLADLARTAARERGWLA